MSLDTARTAAMHHTITCTDTHGHTIVRNSSHRRARAIPIVPLDKRALLVATSQSSCVHNAGTNGITHQRQYFNNQFRSAIGRCKRRSHLRRNICKWPIIGVCSGPRHSTGQLHRMQLGLPLEYSDSRMAMQKTDGVCTQPTSELALDWRLNDMLSTAVLLKSELLGGWESAQR